MVALEEPGMPGQCSMPLASPEHEATEQHETTQTTLEEGAATEPWMPEAAAAWEVDGAGRSPASLLSGEKGTLPSSKLAMVVSTQLVWTAGTKGEIRTLHPGCHCVPVQWGQGFFSQTTEGAPTSLLPPESLLTQVCPDDLQGHVRQHLLDLLCHGHNPHVLGSTPGQAGGHPGPGCRALARGCRREDSGHRVRD